MLIRLIGTTDSVKLCCRIRDSFDFSVKASIILLCGTQADTGFFKGDKRSHSDRNRPMPQAVLVATNPPVWKGEAAAPSAP